ncbi:T9SS type B sorting domain-containing protein [Xanthomarina sp. F2636L]|uniref:T9SS type B sorting domain-containing protein n=1 Tax=Xanthomarina sp. F2636L TaxID=2996018 RepID=UPI00225E4CD5|nr:T9SS type B sorting domain-containing protein [Xanthomarina sp. F2636L]
MACHLGFSQLGGANICEEAEPICSSAEFSFANTSDGTSAEVGPDYGCLLTQPNPAWFFLQIGLSGNINLIIEQSTELGGSPNIDVDFIIYGPFTNTSEACNTSLTAANTVDCSYSPNGIETADIINATTGEYYLLLVTNFSGQAGFISIGQLNGEGSTNCAILEDFTACQGDSFTLDATTPSATDYMWYVEDLSNPGDYLLIPGENSAFYNVDNSYLYRAEAYNTDGDLLQLYDFTVDFLDTPTYPSNVTPFIICDNLDVNDGLAEFDLGTKTSEILDGLDPDLYSVTFYQNEMDAIAEENMLPNLYLNSTNSEVLYVRIENATSTIVNCFDIGTLNIEVNLLPEINLNETYYLCVNTNGSEVVNSLILDTGLNDLNYNFEWIETSHPLDVLSTQSVFEPTQGGVYSVMVTSLSTGCTNTKDILVLESSPPNVVATVTTEAFANNHIIEVTATGDGAAIFEFSINHGPWMSNEPNSNTYTFSNVAFGEHLIQARDINGCGIASDSVLVMDYPLFFTPNNDGYNDTWKIFGLENQFDAKIFIYDRYGKLLKQLSPTGPGWDGTYNGELLPSSDYWFTIDYRELGESEGSQKAYKAHFTLKR